VLNQFSEFELETVGKAQNLAKNNDVKNELYAIHSVKDLANKITKIETRNEYKDIQREILNETREKLNEFSRKKLESSFQEIPIYYL